MSPSTPLKRRFLCAAVAAVALGSCSSDGTVTAADGSTVAPTLPTTTTEPIPEYRSFIAQVNEDVPEITIFDTPGGEQKRLDVKADGELVPVAIPNPLDSGAVANFLVKTPAVEGADGLYHEVYLPVRPNQSTGYVSDEDVALLHTDLAVEISLSEKTMTVLNEGAEVTSYSVAIGTEDNPTPTGTFFIKELLEPPESDGAYGPLAYGLSGHSRSILDSDEFPDGVIGIHGTNKPDLIGQAVSHGCVRLENSTIVDLEDRGLPLGTPVTIVS